MKGSKIAIRKENPERKRSFMVVIDMLLELVPRERVRNGDKRLRWLVRTNQLWI